MRPMTWFAALLLAITLTWGQAARAMMAAVSDNERVAMADLVVVATVASTRAIDGVPSYWAGEITLTVVSTLKGKAPEKLVVRHAAPPKTQPGMIMMDHGGLTFAVGDKRLFFLATFLDSYSLVGGGQGALDPTEAQKYAGLIASNPATITAAPIAGPVGMGGDIPVKVTIANQGKVGLVVWGPQLTGTFLGSDGKTPQFFIARAAGEGPKAGYGTVPAGGKLEIAVVLKAQQPQAKEFAAAGTKVPVRVGVYLMPEGGQPGAGWNAQGGITELTVTPAAPAAK